MFERGYRANEYAKLSYDIINEQHKMTERRDCKLLLANSPADHKRITKDVFAEELGATESLTSSTCSKIFTIYLSAFKSAEKKRKKLEKKGMGARLIPPTINDKRINEIATETKKKAWRLSACAYMLTFVICSEKERLANGNYKYTMVNNENTPASAEAILYNAQLAGINVVSTQKNGFEIKADDDFHAMHLRPVPDILRADPVDIEAAARRLASKLEKLDD